MRYLLLGYGELESLGVELGDELLAGEVLADVDSATTVRVRDGQVAVTDGPAAFEPVGSFLLIDVDDLDAAIAVARRWPAARHGSVEVRPVGT